MADATTTDRKRIAEIRELLEQQLTDAGCVGPDEMGCTRDDVAIPLSEWCVNCLAAALLSASQPSAPVDHEVGLVGYYAELHALKAEVTALHAERDRLVRQIPTEQPPGERLRLNAYGRACYDAGRESAEAEAARLRAALETLATKWKGHLIGNEADWGIFDRCADDLEAALASSGTVPEARERS